MSRFGKRSVRIGRKGLHIGPRGIAKAGKAGRMSPGSTNSAFSKLFGSIKQGRPSVGQTKAKVRLFGTKVSDGAKGAGSKVKSSSRKGATQVKNVKHGKAGPLIQNIGDNIAMKAAEGGSIFAGKRAAALLGVGGGGAIALTHDKFDRENDESIEHQAMGQGEFDDRSFRLNDDKMLFKNAIEEHDLGQDGGKKFSSSKDENPTDRDHSEESFNSNSGLERDESYDDDAQFEHFENSRASDIDHFAGGSSALDNKHFSDLSDHPSFMASHEE